MGGTWIEWVVLGERGLSWEKRVSPGREDLVLGEWGRPGREIVVLGERGLSW